MREDLTRLRRGTCATVAFVPPAPLPGDLSIAVLFTHLDGTMAALKAAAIFSRRLDVLIRLIVLEVVPYPLSLSESPRSELFWRRLLTRLTSVVHVQASIEIYLCRDRRQALRQLFNRSTVFVLGGRKRAWRSPEQRLARWLQDQGHTVLFIASPQP